MNTSTLLAILAVSLAIAAAAPVYVGVLAYRAKRRAAWQLDREEWSRWISRP